MTRLFSLTLIAFLAAVCAEAGNPVPAATTTGPGIIAVGSSLTWMAQNAPDTYTVNTTFSSTPLTVDNGAATIWQEQIPTGSNGEWDIFYLKTTNGGPVAGNINADWAITIQFTFTVPSYSDGSIFQWQVNGIAVSPLTNGIGSICCAMTSTPLSNILPGPAYYNVGNGAEPAGPQNNWQEIYVNPYNYVTSGGINPSTANEFVFALHFTLQALPVVTSVISASQYGVFPTFAPGSWIEIYGNNLSNYTQEWATTNFSGPNNAYAPTVLSGTSVTIGGQSAYTEYVSPTQLDVQVPAGVSTGTQPLVVTTQAGSSTPFNVTVNATQPGLLAPPTSFDINGTQYVVALFSDGITYVLPTGAISGITSKPASPGDTITLYGIGFGSVNEGITPGEIASGQTTLAAPVTFSIGGTSVTPAYAGLAPGFVGLYQFNVTVPSVTASNSVPVTFTQGSASGTQKLYLAIGN